MVQKEPITISYFKAFSNEGEALFRAFQERMDGFMLRGHPVRVVEERSYQMAPALSACFNSDAVIFDGSLEDNENQQYRAALELMKQLDYVLVVSRTVLPFNFSGMRKGGAPEFIATGTTEYCPWKTNEEILAWLMETLQDPSMQLPRKLKMQFSKDKAWEQQEETVRFETQLLNESLARCTHEPGVFVSYLSKYSQYFPGKKTDLPFVEELFDEISRVSSIPKNGIRYFPPGKISLEFMTGQRRFEIVSVTEDFFTWCKAFWIYETEDYASSWWAYGERVSLARIFHNNMENCPDIYTAKPEKKPDGSWGFAIKAYLTAEQKRDFLPSLTKEDMMELIDIYINSHPDSVAYEQVKKMQWLAKMPSFILKAQAETVYERTKLALGDAFAELDEEGRRELETLKDVEVLKRSVRSYAYTKGFWEGHIAECPDCKAQAADTTLEPDSFMHFSKPYFYRLSAATHRKVIKILKNNRKAMVTLPCGHTVKLTSSGTYFRWWTVRSNVPTGPKGQLVEPVELISFF